MRGWGRGGRAACVPAPARRSRCPRGWGGLLPNSRGALAAVGQQPGKEDEAPWDGKQGPHCWLSGHPGSVCAWAFKRRPGGVSFCFSHPAEVRAEAVTTGTTSPLDGSRPCVTARNNLVFSSDYNLLRIQARCSPLLSAAVKETWSLALLQAVTFKMY